MKNKNTPRKSGFTLVELLTVIAIIGILAAILIPTVGSVMDNARKSAASSNLRQIGQAYNIYTAGGSRPKTINLPLTVGSDTFTQDVNGFATLLAKEADLNDPKIWVLGDDDLAAGATLPVVVATQSGGSWTVDGTFSSAPKSFTVMNGLSARASSTTPVGWTRGLNATSGEWDDGDAVYGDEGGHVVFKDGHVEFFDDLLGEDGSGALVNTDGSGATSSILDATGKTAGDVLEDKGS
ncbi:type II secretion system protein [Rubellicoccus peritrichatus]|uniref:Prepilin-type N-terminal cleavage/methylation domain-containing protein n=1 Tax=Rubellicoccus peritrichatus TaxID=3080537 RepID=A0AAQ3LC34_9BACT|nr:prepilin-type N-terminal cleavage/methylation domain-containing protein [Puniceicoccus sp. CR14]WOO43026.1 prepilin-type N-terminal cleavage/methylation domain-containing protein [Puniceicoccus sp. CR14]